MVLPTWLTFGLVLGIIFVATIAVSNLQSGNQNSPTVGRILDQADRAKSFATTTTTLKSTTTTTSKSITTTTIVTTSATTTSTTASSGASGTSKVNAGEVKTGCPCQLFDRTTNRALGTTGNLAWDKALASQIRMDIGHDVEVVDRQGNDLPRQ